MKVNPYVVVGGLASVAAIYLIYSGNKAAQAIGEKAEAVGNFVSNENLFSETADNVVSVISDGRFRDVGDIFFWMAGGDKKVDEALRGSVPLPVPTTAEGV